MLFKKLGFRLWVKAGNIFSASLYICQVFLIPLNACPRRMQRNSGWKLRQRRREATAKKLNSPKVHRRESYLPLPLSPTHIKVRAALHKTSAGSATQRKRTYFRDYTTPIRVPSTFALAHAPPTYQTHRAHTHTSALFAFWVALNAHALTSARSFGFCAIWVYISSSSSSGYVASV